MNLTERYPRALLRTAGAIVLPAVAACGGGDPGASPVQAQEPLAEIIGLNQVCAENATVSLYTVPSNRTFILTDALGNGTVLRLIGGALSPLFTINGETHLCSGFDFPAESQIMFRTPPGQPGIPDSDNGCMAVTGRLE